jgi:hypothetical protein
MKRKLKVDLNELDVALSMGTSEFSYYLDLQTGRVLGVDDDARWTLEELLEEFDAGEGDPLVAFEELLRQRDDIHDWQKSVLLDAARVEFDSKGCYLAIEADDPYQDYNDMASFIGMLDDDDLQEQLERAIHGRGAFRYFKDVVARYPEVQEQWYAYKDAQAERRLLRWLDDHDIELIT